MIPILLSPVDGLDDAPFARFQKLPTDDKPITQWTQWEKQEEALKNVAEGIRKIVGSLRSQKI